MPNIDGKVRIGEGEAPLKAGDRVPGQGEIAPPAKEADTAVIPGPGSPILRTGGIVQYPAIVKLGPAIIAPMSQDCPLQEGDLAGVERVVGEPGQDALGTVPVPLTQGDQGGAFIRLRWGRLSREDAHQTQQ